MLAVASQFNSFGRTIIDRMLKPVEDKIEDINDNIEEMGDAQVVVGRQITTVAEAFAEINKLTEKQAQLQKLGQDLNKGESIRLELLQEATKEQGAFLDLQNQLTEAQSEQLAIEEKQAQLREKQDQLRFLQDQLGIIKTLKDVGIDPSDIFDGISLGLGANLDDLLGVTDAAIDAIINQVDNKLQIASPSQVMAEKGRLAMAGFAEGLAETGRQLPSTLDSVIGSMLGSRALSSGTTNNNSVTININGANINNGTDMRQLGDFIERRVARGVA